MTIILDRQPLDVTPDDYDALTEQICRLVDKFDTREQIDILVNIQDSLRDKPRLIQAGVLAVWLDMLGGA